MYQLVGLPIVIVVACTGHAAVADLYVSPVGHDAWTGTLDKPNQAATDGPLASLAGARDAIRKLKAAEGLQQPIRVHLQNGIVLPAGRQRAKRGRGSFSKKTPVPFLRS